MSRAEPPLVVGVGELLWDIFPDGRRPGGAPANVAYHAGQLGLRGVVYSRVGRDPLGDELVEFLDRQGLSSACVGRDRDHPTGRVTVDLARPDRPSYTIHEDAAWDYLAPAGPIEAVLREAAAICFGTLAQRSGVSRGAIEQCLAAAADGCLVVYDVNLRPPWYDAAWIDRSLRAADVVKLNAEEVAVVAGLLELPDAAPEACARALLARYDRLETVCVTRGADGCLLVDRGGVRSAAGIQVPAADPVGAGDAFTAALIFSRLQRWPLAMAARFCNLVAALVAGRRGAMPDVRRQLAEIIAQTQN